MGQRQEAAHLGAYTMRSRVVYRQQSKHIHHLCRNDAVYQCMPSVLEFDNEDKRVREYKQMIVQSDEHLKLYY